MDRPASVASPPGQEKGTDDVLANCDITVVLTLLIEIEARVADKTLTAILMMNPDLQ